MVFYRKVFAMQKQCNPEVGTWAFQLLKNINRFAQSGVSSNLWSYRAFPEKVRRGMAVFPIGMALSSHQYFALKIWSRTSKLVSV